MIGDARYVCLLDASMCQPEWSSKGLERKMTILLIVYVHELVE
jgi:hypothetical protein